MNAAEIKLENVMSVYSGRAGACCCGCAGKHSYASAHREAASKNRGYAVEDKDVSDRSVKLIFNKVIANLDLADDDRDSGNISVEIGSRLWVLYFVPTPKGGAL